MELILIVVLFGFLWNSFTKLNSRIEDLERRLGVKDKTKVVTPLYGEAYTTPATSVVSEQVSAEQTPLSVYSSEAQQVPELSGSYETKMVSIFDIFFIWLKKEFFMKLGALFLLMGMGWFVSYAFTHNWIGPSGRIMLGLLTGACILGIGAWRIRTYLHQGTIFTVLGSSVILTTLSSARGVYDMFTPTSALFLMFLSVVYVAYVSVRYRSIGLAMSSLIFAGIAPHLTFAPTPLIMEEFAYLFVMSLGTLWVVYVTRWRSLTLTALVIVFFETLPYMTMQGSEGMLVLLWVFLFVALFFVANMVSIVRVHGTTLSTSQLYTAAGTVLFLILWVLVASPKEFQSLLFITWMLVFAYGAYITYVATENKIPFYVYGSASIALLGAATAIELNGAVLTIVFTIEIVMLLVGAFLLRLGDKVVGALSLLFGIPVFMSFSHLGSSAWYSGVLHADFFALLVILLIFGTVGVFLFENVRARREEFPQTYGVSGTLMGTAVFYIFALTPRVCNGIFHTPLDSNGGPMLSLLTSAYMFEVIAVCMIGFMLHLKESTIACLSILFALPVILSFGHIGSSAWDTGVLHTDFLSLTLMCVVFSTLGVLWYAGSRSNDNLPWLSKASWVFMALGVWYLFALTPLVSNGIFANPPHASTLAKALISIAYTLEILGIITVAFALHFSERVVQRLSTLFGIPIFLSLPHIMSPLWKSGVFHPDFFALVVLALVLALVGVVYRERARMSGVVDAAQQNPTNTLIGFSAMYVLILVWLVSHGLFSPDIATMVSLTTYTLMGITAFVAGRNLGVRVYTNAGMILLLFVAGRLLLVDVWHMELFGRIITFLVVGVLFISTAFMRRGGSDAVTELDTSHL